MPILQLVNNNVATKSKNQNKKDNFFFFFVDRLKKINFIVFDEQ